MYRFIALIWNGADPTRTETARFVSRRIRALGPEWGCVHAENGLSIFHTGARAASSHAYPLQDRAGAVLGRLFQNSVDDGTPHEAVFDEPTARRIIDTHGRHLVERYWGRYVAFWYDRRRNKHCVLRDPSSAIPCFTLKHRGVNVFYSHMQDVVRFEFLPFSVNWKYVTKYLLYEGIRVRETGLNEVSEVLAGECMEIDGDAATSEFRWDPARVCSNAIEDPVEAAAALRQTTSACVAAWSSCYQRIIHELSGGLDSSIVLACLARAPTRPNVLCLNYRTDDRAGADEREFARIAAQHAGCELIERVVQPASDIWQRLFALPRLERPHRYALASGFDDLFIEIAKERGAGAFFSGTGGDHHFHQMKTKLVAADYAYRHGLRRELLSVARDTARITRESFWAVLRTALTYGVLRRPRKPFAFLEKMETFLNDEIPATLLAEEILHPWLRTGAAVPPAKLEQIVVLIDLQGYYYPFGRAEYADVVFPLFSQPLTELCLRIPTDVLTKGGRDRALVRRAFAADLPTEVVQRQAKGNTTSYFSGLFARDLGFLREFLLDGALAQQGPINRRKLERALSREQVTRDELNSPILECIVLEGWLRSWSTVACRVAA